MDDKNLDEQLILKKLQKKDQKWMKKYECGKFSPELHEIMQQKNELLAEETVKLQEDVNRLMKNIKRHPEQEKLLKYVQESINNNFWLSKKEEQEVDEELKQIQEEIEREKQSKNGNDIVHQKQMLINLKGATVSANALTPRNSQGISHQ